MDSKLKNLMNAIKNCGFLRNRSKYVYRILDFYASYFSWLTVLINSKYWMTSIAQNILRVDNKKNRFFGALKNFFYSMHQPRYWWKPILFSASVVFIPIVIIFFSSNTSMIPFTSTIKWDLDNCFNILQTSWQVTSGLIGITFVIVIFLVEFANGNNIGRRVSPIIFEYSWMLFTAAFGIFVILSQGFTSILISRENLSQGVIVRFLLIQYVLFVINTLLILRLFICSVRMLSRNYFLGIISKYNHRLASQKTESELIYRLITNHPFELFLKLGITYPFFEPEILPSESLVVFKNLTPSVQKVVDINPKLVEISFINAKRILSNIGQNDFIFFAKIDHRISSEKPGIALVTPTINRPSVTRYLERAIKLKHISRLSDFEFTDEFEINRDFLLQAIKNRDLSTVKEILSNYFDVIESFLQTTNAFGIKYDISTAAKELNAFSSWKLVTLIYDQYRALTPFFLGTDDLEMAHEFLHFPFDLMELSLKYKDHYIYQKFSRLFSFIYFNCRELKDNKQKTSIVSFISHMLVDHRRFHLNPRIQKVSDIASEIGEFTDYYQDLFVCWNSLLKQAIDDKSPEFFSSFTDEIRTIIGSFFPEIDESTQIIIESYIKLHPDIDQYQKELKLTQEKLFFKNQITYFGLTLFLGFGGWICHLYEKNKINYDEYLVFIEAINKSFTEFKTLFETYSIHVKNRNGEDVFEWSSWEMSEWTSQYGEVSSGTLTYRMWIENYFVIRLLEVLHIERDNSDLLQPTTLIKGILATVKNRFEDLFKQEKWLIIFDRLKIQQLEKRKKVLLKILQDASDIQKILEEEDVMASELDADLVTVFKKEVKSNWEKNSYICRLSKNYGKYIEKKLSIVDFHKFPVYSASQLMPKEVLLKQNRVSYIGWGDSFGDSLAIFENKHLSTQFYSENLQSIDYSLLEDHLQEAIFNFQNVGLKPIILVKGSEVIMQLSSFKDFIPAWRTGDKPNDNIPSVGMYKEIPIIHNTGGINNTVSIIDFFQFGLLVRYLPDENSGEIPLTIDLLSNQEAEEILDKNPDWMTDSESKQTLNHDDSIRKILQNVRVTVSGYCRFEDIDYRACKSYGVNYIKPNAVVDETSTRP